MRCRSISGGHATVGQVTTFDLKHLTWNAGKKQISLSLQASVAMTAARVAELLMSLKALAVCMFPHYLKCWISRRSKRFVSWMQIITPVFRIKLWAHGDIRRRSSAPHLVLCLRPSAAFNAAKGKIWFMTGKAFSVRRDSPRDMQRKVGKKSSPISSVIALHVMSAWRAHCLHWQSRTMNPVLHSGPKYLGNTLNIDPLTVRHFPETGLLWSEYRMWGSKAFTYLKKQTSCFLLKSAL